MERSERKVAFRKDERVLYRGRHWYWGNRSGGRRVLATSLKTGQGGIMVMESEAFVSIFPLPKGKAYAPHHAVRWEHSTPRSVRIRFFIVQTGPENWQGGIKAKYGVYGDLTRDEEINDQHGCFESELGAVNGLLKAVLHDLIELSLINAAGQRLAQTTARSLAERLPPELSSPFRCLAGAANV